VVCGSGRRASGFFLPIGHVGALEEEVFFLEELQSVGYDSIMALPWSRRKRFVEKKNDLEKRKADQARQAANRARSMSRRRR